MSIPEPMASPMRTKRLSRTEYPDSLALPRSPELIDWMNATRSSKTCFTLTTVFPCQPSVDADESSETWSAASERGKSRSEILIS
ncbi:hypothetical protein C7212DRAFT_353688 [Tuber magnatum]|uniref:Uncharacterized protein n=1 Tax=Tuber magnatum TaxID=42249 RepID=A0A317SJU3_9PEZI|nr:hypothetical protein C7212DRAFT_353688 [Tuber magnatum]